MPLFIPDTGFTGFRNRLINGDMRIDQRNNAAAQTITAAAALAYTVDRWYAWCTGANVTGQQVAGSLDDQYRYQFTGAASVTAINFAQRIEAMNSYDMNDKSVTFSVELANSLLTSVNWEIFRATTTADTFGSLAAPTVTSISSGTFTVSSTLTRYSATITLPTAAITGLQIVLSVGAQTSGTWTIGSAQFELGPMTTFERRPVGVELLMCQRYLPAFKSSSTNSTLNWTGFGANTVAATGQFKFPVQARVAATGLTVSAASHISASRPSTGNVTANAVSFAVSSRDNAQVELGFASGIVADMGYFAYFNNASGNLYFNGCEL